MNESLHDRAIDVAERPWTETFGPAFPLVAGALWGTIGIVSKGLLDANYHPVQIVVWRLIIASVLGQVILLLYNRGFKAPRMPLPFLIHGLLGTVLTQLLYLGGVRSIGVALTVTLHFTWPAFAVFLGRMVFQEPLHRLKLLAALLSVAGAALVSTVALDVSLQISALGLVMAILSGITFAAGGTMAKYELQTASRLEVIVWPMTLATLPLAVYAGSIGQLAPTFSVGVPTMQILYLAVVTTFAAHGLYTVGLKTLASGTAAILATVEPVVAVVLASLLFGETLHTNQWLGLSLIVLGVVIVNMRRRALRRPAQLAP